MALEKILSRIIRWRINERNKRDIGWLDKTPKEELLKTQGRVKKEFWDNHRHKIIISVIIFYLFFIPFYNKYGFDREGLLFILTSTVAILIWYFKGKSVEVPDDPF